MGPIEETLQVLVREENRTPGIFTNDIRECMQVKSSLDSGGRAPRRDGAMWASCTAERRKARKSFLKPTSATIFAVRKQTSLQAGNNVLSEQQDIEHELVDVFTKLPSERKDTDEAILARFFELVPEVPLDGSGEKNNEEITDHEIEAEIKDLEHANTALFVSSIGCCFFFFFRAVFYS